MSGAFVLFQLLIFSFTIDPYFYFIISAPTTVPLDEGYSYGGTIGSVTGFDLEGGFFDRTSQSARRTSLSFAKNKCRIEARPNLPHGTLIVVSQQILNRHEGRIFFSEAPEGSTRAGKQRRGRSPAWLPTQARAIFHFLVFVQI